MRNIVLLFTLLTVTTISTAQKDKAYDRMAQSVCGCVSGKSDELKDASQSQFEMALGVCMFKAFKEDEKFYESKGIKFTTAGTSMEELGEEIGLKMAERCPDILMSIASHYVDDEDFVEEASEEVFAVTGAIQSIEEGSFHTLIIKGNDGRTYKMLWLTYVTNHDLLLEAITNKKTYTFNYYETEMYDNRINEYRNMLIIDSLTEE